MPKDLCLSIHATDVSAASSGSGGSNTWIHLLPAGRFSGRTGRGPFSVGSRTEMAAIVEASLKRAGRTELVVDYDHQSVFGAVPGTGGRAPAAGWIKELEVRDDGIWGRVEWTEAAAQAIRNGEYRYISPVFFYTKAGKVISIRNAGLTNTPDLDLDEVAASAFVSQTEQESDMDKILEALGLDKGSGEDAALSEINSLLSSTSAFAAAAGLEKDAKHDDVLTAVNSAFDAQKGLGLVAAAVSAGADAKPDAVLTAVNSAIAAKANPDPSKFVPIEQLTALSQEVKSLRQGLDEDKATAAVEAAMSEGKIAPAVKDWALSYANEDLEGFKAFAASAPVVVKPQTPPSKKTAADVAVNDESDEVAMSALGISKEDFAAARKLETD